MPSQLDSVTANSMNNDLVLINIREKYTSIFWVILTAGISVFAFTKLTNKI
jgi:membrane protein required for beta-lactamase induction